MTIIRVGKPVREHVVTCILWPEISLIYIKDECYGTKNVRRQSASQIKYLFVISITDSVKMVISCLPESSLLGFPHYGVGIWLPVPFSLGEYLLLDHYLLWLTGRAQLGLGAIVDLGAQLDPGVLLSPELYSVWSFIWPGSSARSDISTQSENSAWPESSTLPGNSTRLRSSTLPRNSTQYKNHDHQDRQRPC